jgi:hypothetical protein
MEKGYPVRIYICFNVFGKVAPVERDGVALVQRLGPILQLAGVTD